MAVPTPQADPAFVLYIRPPLERVTTCTSAWKSALYMVRVSDAARWNPAKEPFQLTPAPRTVTLPPLVKMAALVMLAREEFDSVISTFTLVWARRLTPLLSRLLMTIGETVPEDET